MAKGRSYDMPKTGGSHNPASWGGDSGAPRDPGGTGGEGSGTGGGSGGGLGGGRGAEAQPPECWLDRVDAEAAAGLQSQHVLTLVRAPDGRTEARRRDRRVGDLPGACADQAAILRAATARVVRVRAASASEPVGVLVSPVPGP